MRIASGLVGTVLAASFAIASAMPLNAAPVYVPKSPEASANVEKAHYVQRRYRKRHGLRYSSRYRDRCYYDLYYCGPRYYYPRHYYPYRHRGWHRGGVTLEFSF